MIIPLCKSVLDFFPFHLIALLFDAIEPDFGLPLMRPHFYSPKPLIEDYDKKSHPRF